MAGKVPAHLLLGDEADWYFVEPQHCPVADQHRRDAAEDEPSLAPRCLSNSPLAGRRTCPYWYGFTTMDNAAHRTDVTMIAGMAAQREWRQIRCGVLCMGQRRNVPPGT
jgi:hypothetical protein